MTNAPISITIQPFDEDTLKLSVPYDLPTIAIIKQLPRRQWSKQEKCWFIPNDRAVVDQLVQLFGSNRIIDTTTCPRETEATAPDVASVPKEPSVAPRNPVNIPEFIARLERELRARNYSQRTIQNYCPAVRRFCEEIHADPAAIDQNVLKQYLIDLNMKHGFSPRTVNLWTAAISFFYLHVLKKAEPVESLPRMKTGRSLPGIYSEEEVGGILSAVENTKHRLILMIAYGCGLRLSEIRSLKPDDISIDRHLLTVRQGKGRKDRTIMIDETLLPVIDAYLKHGRGKIWMFEGPSPGHRLTTRTISLIFEHACYKAEVKRHGGIHGLRHSFATHLMEHGTGIRAIQELLGHGSSKTTEIYTHVSKAMIGKIRSPLANVKIHPIHEKG